MQCMIDLLNMSLKLYVLIGVLTILGLISIVYLGVHNPIETVTEEVIDVVEHNPSGTTDLSKIIDKHPENEKYKSKSKRDR